MNNLKICKLFNA